MRRPPVIARKGKFAVFNWKEFHIPQLDTLQEAQSMADSFGGYSEGWAVIDDKGQLLNEPKTPNK